MPTAKVNGTNLYYEIRGEGPPILLIHGLGSRSEDWEFQISELAQEHLVIAPDLRGHGRSSDPVGPYSMAIFARDLAELLRTLKTGAVHAIGVSLGGMVAFQLAIDAPELVRTLVIVNSGPEVIPRTFKEKASIGLRFAIVRFLGLPRFGAMLGKRLFPHQTRLRASFENRFGQNRKRPYLDSLRAIVGWSVTPKLGSIRSPILVISSDNDYTPVAAKEAYLPKLRDARLVVIPNSRHATPLDQPAAFNSAIKEFVQQQRGMAPF